MTNPDDERRITDATICIVCGDESFTGSLCWKCRAERNGVRVNTVRRRDAWCPCLPHQRRRDDASECEVCGKRHRETPCDTRPRP